MIAAEQREAKRAYCAAWYQDHREEQLAYQKRRYIVHGDALRAYRREYCDEHGDSIRAYQADYYLANRVALLEKQAEFTEWLQILRTNNGCEDCGTHEGRLHHHHLNPSTKRYNVSEMYSHSLDALEDELEKCVVLCRSCHKKRHEEMRAA